MVNYRRLLFHWETLGQTIIYITMISEMEKENAWIYIVDAKGLVQADNSDNQIIRDP